MIKFNVGIYMEGNIVKDRREIAMSYLRNDFFFDVISTISFIIDLFAETRYFLLLFLVRTT